MPEEKLNPSTNLPENNKNFNPDLFIKSTENPEQIVTGNIVKHSQLDYKKYHDVIGDKFQLTTPEVKLQKMYDDSIAKAEHNKAVKDANDQGFFFGTNNIMDSELANSIMSFGGNALWAVPKYLGYILDLEATGNFLFGDLLGAYDPNTSWDNWLSNWAQENQDSWNNTFKVNMSPEGEGGVWQNSRQWFMGTFIPQLGDQVGMQMVTAGLGSGFSLGSKLVSTTSPSVNYFRRGLFQGIVSRDMEGKAEASQTYKEEYDKLINSINPNTGEKFTKEEAHDLANEAATFTYKTNWTNIVLDVPEQLLLLRGMQVSKAVDDVAVARAAGKSKASARINALKSDAKAFGLESLEEIDQYIINKEATHMADVKAGIKEDSDFSKRLNQYFNESELWEAGFLGGLSGSVMRRLQPKVVDFINKKRSPEYKTEREERIQEIRDRQASVSQALDTMTKAKQSNNEEAYKTAKNQLKVDTAIRAAKSGNLDLYLAQLDSFQNLNDDQLSKLGLDPSIKEEIPTLKEDIKWVANKYNETTSKYVALTVPSILHRELARKKLNDELPTIRKNYSEAFNIPGISELSIDSRSYLENDIKLSALKASIVALTGLGYDSNSNAIKSKVSEIEDLENANKELKDNNLLSKKDIEHVNSIPKNDIEKLTKLKINEIIHSDQILQFGKEINELTSKSFQKEALSKEKEVEKEKIKKQNIDTPDPSNKPQSNVDNPEAEKKAEEEIKSKENLDKEEEVEPDFSYLDDEYSSSEEDALALQEDMPEVPPVSNKQQKETIEVIKNNNTVSTEEVRIEYPDPKDLVKDNQEQELDHSKNFMSAAWLSVRNTKAEDKDKTEFNKARTEFLEGNTNLSQYTIELSIDYDYMKDKDNFKSTLSKLESKEELTETELNKLPIKASFTEYGYPVNYSGHDMYVHLRTSDYSKNDNKDLAKQKLNAIRLSVIFAERSGNKVTTKVTGTSNGYFPISDYSAQNNVAEVLKQDPEDVILSVTNGERYLAAEGERQELDGYKPKRQGAIYAVAYDRNDNTVPMRVFTDYLSNSECNLVYKVYRAAMIRGVDFTDRLDEQTIKNIKESKDPRINQIDTFMDLETSTYGDILRLFVYQTSPGVDVRKPIYLNEGKLQIGNDSYTKESMKNPLTEEEILNKLKTFVRQINRKKLDDPNYKKYLINNKIITTNTDIPTLDTVKSPMVQPLISFDENIEIIDPNKKQDKRQELIDEMKATESFGILDELVGGVNNDISGAVNKTWRQYYEDKLNDLDNKEIINQSNDLDSKEDIKDDLDKVNKATKNITKEDQDKFNGLFKLEHPIITPSDIIDLETELAWYKRNLPQVPVEIVKELISVNSKGVKAFGMFMDSMVTISEKATKGTGYHEAFHAVFNLLLTQEEREQILNEASEKYGIPRSYTNSDKPMYKLSDGREVSVEYLLKAQDILQSEQADKIFEKGFKNKWELSKILTELNIPKDQKDLIIDLTNNMVYIEGIPFNHQLAMELASKYAYTVEINTAKDKTDYRFKDNAELADYGRGSGYEDFEFEGSKYIQKEELDFDGENRTYFYKDDKKITKREFNETAKKLSPKIIDRNSSYYSNLTVPGGTNYTENEIATPAITPSIKGHAQFSTDNGIGWFRSDDKQDFKEEDLKRVEDEIGIPRNKFNYQSSEFANGITTKTRRILEVQSDLFQKGRDRDELIEREQNVYSERVKLHTLKNSIKNIQIYLDKINTAITNIESNNFTSGVEGFSYFIEVNTVNYKKVFAGNTYNNAPINIEVALEKLKKDKNKYEDEIQKLQTSVENIDENLITNNTKDNQFLRLLNKDNNWVTFFVKSIIQDSAKKGYEKVLFPKGNTASKIEGHTTLEEFKKQKEDRIKELESRKKQDAYSIITASTVFTSKISSRLRESYNEELRSKAKEVEGKYIVVDKSIGSDGRSYGVNLPQDLNNITLYNSEKDARDYAKSLGTHEDIEINQLKQELERVETEGFGALKPIYNFYENTVANILKKQGYNPTLITDEYGNTWNEVTLTDDIKNKKILLKTEDKSYYSQLSGDSQLEERIAEEWELNKLNDRVPEKKTAIGRFLYKLKELFRNIFSKKLTINKLYERMNSGYYNNKKLNIPTKSETMYKRRVDGFSTAELDSTVKTLLYVMFHTRNNTDIRNISDLNPDNARKYLLSMVTKSKDINDLESTTRYLKILNAFTTNDYNQVDKNSNLFKAINEELASYGVIYKESSKKDLVKNIEDVQEDELQSTIEESGFSFKPHYQLDDMENSTAAIKLLLATVPMIKSKNVDGSYNYYIDPFTGLPRLEEFEEIVKKVKNICADIIPIYQDGKLQDGFKLMLDKLNEESTYYPSLAKLANTLENSAEQIQTQFYSTMSGTKIEYSSTFIKEDGNVNIGNPDVQSPDKKLRAEWGERFLDEVLSQTDNGVEVNTTKLKKAIDTYSQFKATLDSTKGDTLSDGIIDEFINTLSLIGIDMTFNGALRAIDFAHGSNRLTKLKNILTSETYNLNQLYVSELPKLMKGIQEDALGQIKSPLEGEKSVLYLAEHQSHLNSAYGKQTILMTEGNSYSVFSKHNLITKTIASLKKDPSLAKTLRDNYVYNKNSLFLNEFINNPKSLEKFSATYYGHFKDEQDPEGKNQSDLPEGDEIIDRLSRISQGTWVNLAKADKPTDIQFKGIAMHQSGLYLNKGQIMLSNKTDVVKIFLGYILDEHNRALSVWEDLHNENFKKSDYVAYLHTQKKGLKHHLFPSLTFGNNPEVEDPFNLYHTNGKPKVLSMQDLLANEELIKHIRSSFVNQCKKELDRWIKNNLIKKDYSNNFIPKNLIAGYKRNSNDAIVALAGDFVLNGIIGSVEMTKIFTQDPALYKEKGGNLFEDFAKRVPATSASGSDFRVLPDMKSSYTSVTIKNIDKKKSSVYSTPEFHKMYKQALASRYPELSSNELDKLTERNLKSYDEINITDAQAYITLDAYKTRMRGLGKWTEYHDKVYNAIKKYEEVPTTDRYMYAQELSLKYNIGFQPLKTVHVENMPYKQYMTLQYNKQSEAVLNPLFTIGTDLDKLRLAMERDGVDHVVVEDGKKAGAIGVYDVSNEDGNLRNDIDFKQSGVIRNLNYNYLSLQQDLPYKGLKDTLLGSQVKKNIKANILLDGDYNLDGEDIKGKDLIQMLDELEIAISNKGKESITQEFGYDPENKTVNPDKIRNFLLQAMLDRPTIYNAVEALEFGLPIEAIPSFRKKFQNQLLAAITKETVKVKTFGGSFIQMSDFGFHTLDSANKQGTIWLVEPSRLKPPRLEVKDGKVVAVPGQVLLPYTAIKDIPGHKHMSKAELLRHIDPRLLQGLGYRIPNQNTCSIDIIEVVGILPASAGDTMIAYSEITTKTGSDFDIDKQYVSLPAYEVKDGKLVYSEFKKELGFNQSKEALDNRRLEIYKSILLDPKTFTFLIKPLDDDTLKNDLVSLYPVSKQGDLEWWTPGNQMDIKRQFQGGKFGVGQTANQLTDHPLSQLADLKLAYNIGGITDEFTGVTTLSSQKNEDGVYISDVIAMFLNAYVDIAKDPFIERGNHNTITANVVFTLARAGVSLKWINRFIGQPIIREYVKMKQYNENSFVDYNNKKDVEDLKKQFGLHVFETTADKTSDIPISILEKTLYDNNIEGNKEIHANVLNLFVSLRDTAQLVNEQLMVSKSDTQGATKTLTSARVLSLLKNRVANDTRLINFSNKFENTALEAQYNNSVQLALDMFSNTFFSETDTAQTTLDSVLTELGLKHLLSNKGEEIRNKVLDSFYAYVLHNKLGISKDQVKNLFEGDDSIVKRFNKFKYSSNEDIKNRPLIKYLITKRGYKDIPDFVGVTKTKQVSVSTQNLIYRDWEDMLTDPNENLRKFAHDLINYSIYTSGFMNGLYTFHEYIPSSWIKDNGIMNFMEDTMKDFNSNPSILDGFMDQLVRNPSSRKLLNIPFVKKSIPLNKVSQKAAFGIAMNKKNIVGLNENGAPEMSRYVTNGKSLYKLRGYKFKEERGVKKAIGIYVYTPNLGLDIAGRAIIEYYPESNAPQSALSINKINLTNEEQEQVKQLLQSGFIDRGIMPVVGNSDEDITEDNEAKDREDDGVDFVCVID